jgi:hypothetical protein
MTNQSPFAPYRSEYEPRHLYYLPNMPFSLLESPSQVYIIGSRGTGKTTLMRAIYWEERFENEILQKALGGALFDKRYVGVYIKIPGILVAGFERWSKSLPEDVVALLFGLFLDLAWVDSIFLGVSELSRNKILKMKPSTEHRFVQLLIEDHPELGQFLPAVGPYSLVTLARAIRSMRSKFERCINLGLDHQEILGCFQVSQVGSFGREMASKLGRLCDDASHGDGKWYFKVCLDEAECLSLFQQKVVNTIIRLSQWPLFYVVSFVSPIGDFSSTVLPKMTLQKADRDFLMLDQMTDTDFRNFSEGVASVRVSSALNQKRTLDLTRILGRLDINRLLQDILRESEDPRAKELLEKAVALKHSSFFGFDKRDEGNNDLEIEANGELPIYQAYLVEQLNLEAPKSQDPRWRKRNQQSREIRKRMVAAYLSICSELDQEVRYASVDMVLQISDKCIRDLLWQLHCILMESGKDLDSMIRTGVSVPRQNRGIRRASEEKLLNLTKSGVTAPAEVLRVVEGLAKVTAKIQRGERGKRALLSSERGIFSLDTKTLTMQHPPILEILREASEAGYLKMLSEDEKKWRFRVHCSLAAAYGFSYRGAYYDVPIGMLELEKLRTAEGKDMLERAIASISDRLMGSLLITPSLFDGEA